MKGCQTIGMSRARWILGMECETPLFISWWASTWWKLEPNFGCCRWLLWKAPQIISFSLVEHEKLLNFIRWLQMETIDMFAPTFMTMEGRKTTCYHGIKTLFNFTSNIQIKTLFLCRVIFASQPLSVSCAWREKELNGWEKNFFPGDWVVSELMMKSDNADASSRVQKSKYFPSEIICFKLDLRLAFCDGFVLTSTASTY